MKDRKLNSIFPKSMFWDVKMEELSIKHDEEFIIERVLGTPKCDEKHFDNLEKLYSVPKIKHFALKSEAIVGNETIEFVAKRYGLNPKEFKSWVDL